MTEPWDTNVAVTPQNETKRFANTFYFLALKNLKPNMSLKSTVDNMTAADLACFD